MKKQAKRLLWDQRRQFWRLVNDRKPLGLANLRPLHSSRRFSARLWGSGRCPQLRQQFVHPSTHLLRRELAMLVFPQTQLSYSQTTCQNQKIMRNGNDEAPTLELFWGTQTRLIPKQCLFVKAIAMFLAKAMDISQSHLRDVRILVPNPDEPTDTGIALAICRRWAYDANDRQFQPISAFDVQVLPPGDLDHSLGCIQAFPVSIRLPVSRLIVGLQFLASLTRCSPFACWRRRWAIKTAVAFETDQRPLDGQRAAFAPQPGRIVSSIHVANGVLRQTPGHLCQLCKSNLCGGHLRTYALLIQDVGPTTRCLRQDHHRRKLPSVGHRFLAFRQIMHVLRAAICRGNRFRARYPACVNRDQQRFLLAGLRQKMDKDLLQALLVNLSVFQSLIQAGPPTLERWRQRQFWERLRPIFADQRVRQIEQGIFRSLETTIDPMTKRFQCVKVHPSNAPFVLFVISEQYSVWQSFAREVACFGYVSLNKNLLQIANSPLLMLNLLHISISVVVKIAVCWQLIAAILQCFYDHLLKADNHCCI